MCSNLNVSLNNDRKIEEGRTRKKMNFGSTSVLKGSSKEMITTISKGFFLNLKLQSKYVISCNGIVLFPNSLYKISHKVL